MNPAPRSSTLFHVALTGLLAATLGYSLYLHRQLDATQAQLSTEKSLHALARAHAVQSARSAATKPPKATDRPTTPVADTSPVPSAEASGETTLYREFSKYPDRRRLRLAYVVYGNVLRRLKMDPVQTQKAAELLVEREISMQEARLAATQVGLGNSRIDEALAASTKEVDARLQELLGAERFGRVMDAPKVNMMQGALIASVGIDMSIAGVPLSEEQASQVAEIWSKAQDIQMNPALRQMVLRPVNPASGLSPMQESIVTQAAAVLSPQQNAILRSSFAEQSAPKKDPTLAALKPD